MESADLLIQHGHVITQNPEGDEYTDGAIAIKDGNIEAVGESAELALRYDARRTMDATGRFVFPGLINTHTHLFQNFLKGLGEGVFVHNWIVTVTIPAVH
ncbi:amidohydrolase, partial [Chloroflexota bacterium]